MVDNDTPSDKPDAQSATPPPGVSVLLQFIHADRGSAELPPPNNGNQLHRMGVYTRLTSTGNGMSNPLDRVSMRTVARDF